MATMRIIPLDNDVRGWIMTVVSGIGMHTHISHSHVDQYAVRLTLYAACVIGSSIICVDLLLRRIRKWEDFSIQDSSHFLACSMSLSFGVMVMSARDAVRLLTLLIPLQI